MRPSPTCVDDTIIRNPANFWTTEGTQECECAAWLVANDNLTEGDLIKVHPVRSLVINHLLSHRRSNDDDPFPESGDRRGWWADSLNEGGEQLGSRLWLLERRATVAETLREAEQMVDEGLSWLMAEEVISSVETIASFEYGDHIRLDIKVMSPEGLIDIALGGQAAGFGYVWQEIAA